MRFSSSWSWAALGVVILTAGGCGQAQLVSGDHGPGSVVTPPPGSDGAAPVTGNDVASSVAPPPVGGVTFYKDILPITQDNCQTCHVAGGIGPFPLGSYEEVKAQGQKMVVATQSKIMPPWKPADDCRPLQGVRRLTDDEISAISSWVKNGMVAGDPADAPPPPPVEPDPPTPDVMVSMTERYLPDQTLTDDYRCFVIDPQLADDVHVTGFTITPGNRAIVHHILVYIAAGDQVAEAEMLDAQDAGSGYTCFGGPNLTASAGAGLISPIVGGWAPGAPNPTFPAGTGILIPGGSRLILQVHYNVPNSPNTDDLSQVGLYLAKPTDVLIDAYQLPFAVSDLDIKAGDPHSVATNSVTLPLAVRIYGTSPHMHLRGTDISAKITRADGTDECLIHIPDWDFHWQGGYDFVTPIDYMPGDTVTQTCIYDNSAGNQPLGPDGQPVTPMDLHWGEKTTDEMCLTFSYVTQVPSP